VRRAWALALTFALLAGLAPPVAAKTLQIAVISDLNGRYGSTEYSPRVAKAIAAIIARKPDLVISTGDMIAGQRADPKLSSEDLAAMWAAFHATVSDPLARAGIPLLVTPGNHDASASPGYEHERRAFAAAWADRRPDLPLIDGANWPFRIAATLDGTLLVGMDVTRSGPLDAASLSWLDGLLSDPAHKGNTILLFGHIPLMPISQGREGDILADPALFSLAQQAGVDLWLSGHHHAFYGGTAGGILFSAQGALGNGPRALITQTARSPHSFTWVEITEDGRITVAALPGPDFAVPLAITSLPATLGDGPFRLRRSATHPD